MLAASVPISIPKEFLEQFCRGNHIRKLSFFGSILTPRFGTESDVDILVEFDQRHVPSYFDLARMEMELSETLGRKVDLRTVAELSRYFRAQVIASAVPQYERS